MVLPSEQSFISEQPLQSSPEKLVTVRKSGTIAKYLWDTGRRLRSQVKGPVIHVQIGSRGRRK